jgi:hypothetical protein
MKKVHPILYNKIGSMRQKNKRGSMRPFFIMEQSSLKSGSVQIHVIHIHLCTRRASLYRYYSSFNGFYNFFTGIFVPNFMIKLYSVNRHSTVAPS